jgi:hypothetical protein
MECCRNALLVVLVLVLVLVAVLALVPHAQLHP